MINFYIKRGFSLIELFIVITIMGILVSFAIPHYMDVTSDAKIVKARQDLDALKDAVRKYSVMNKGIFPRSILDLRGIIKNVPPTTPWGDMYQMDSFFIFCIVPAGETSAKQKRVLRVAFRNPGLMLISSSKGYSGQGKGLYTVKPMPDSEPPAKVTLPDNSPDCPSWREQGSRLLYATGSPGTIKEVFTFSGAPSESMFNSLGLSGSSPAMNRSGTYLAYVAPEGIYVTAGMKGSEVLIPDTAGYDSPVWSPTSDVLACVGNSQVHIIQEPSGRLKHWQLTSAGGSDPAWSPDGSQIAFENSGDIWILAWSAIKGVDPANPLVSKLNRGPNKFTDKYSEKVYKPAWSPDGNLLAAIRRDNSIVVFNVERPTNNYQIRYLRAGGLEDGILLEDVDKDDDTIVWAE